MASLRCVVLPLSTRFALLPSELVHALLYNENVKPPGPQAPSWLIGSISREASGPLPLLSLDKLCGLEDALSELGHIALIRCLNGPEERVRFAVRLTAAPWVVHVDSANVTRAAADTDDLAHAACQIWLDGSLGFIPDIDSIESAIAQLPRQAYSSNL